MNMFNGKELKDVTELQRICAALGINPNEDNLCLKAQDKIKENQKLINKLNFMNTMLKSKLKTDNVGLTYKVEDNKLKEENQKLKDELAMAYLVAEGLRKEIMLYREDSFKNRLKSVIGGV